MFLSIFNFVTSLSLSVNNFGPRFRSMSEIWLAVEQKNMVRDSCRTQYYIPTTVTVL